MEQRRNCSYSIFVNRCKQKDPFIWKNMHQSILRKLKKSPPNYFISSELNKSFPVRCWLTRNCSQHCGKRMLDMIGSCSWTTQNTSQFSAAECAWCNCKHSATCNIKLCVQFMTAQFEICVGDMYKGKLQSILGKLQSILEKWPKF